MDSTTVIAEQDLKDVAFRVRQENFSNEITFHAPGLKPYEVSGFKQTKPNAFLPVSVTGKACALDCDHCDSRILDPMIPLDPKKGLFDLARTLHKAGTEALLVSGGSKKDGMVPLMKHMDDLARIKQELGMKIIAHTGLVDEEMAVGLKNAGVDGVALDIIGANDTIRDVYHLDCTIDDYDMSLKVLTDHGLSIRPHIILGLHYGKFLGEYTALDMIKKYPVHALVIVILTPLHDTPMRGVSPPDTRLVEKFFQDARIAMPDSKIMVGCARPAGEYKKIVDIAAIDAGLNGIAYPAEGVVEYATSKGLKACFFENSCSCGVD